MSDMVTWHTDGNGSGRAYRCGETVTVSPADRGRLAAHDLPLHVAAELGQALIRLADKVEEGRAWTTIGPTNATTGARSGRQAIPSSST